MCLEICVAFVLSGRALAEMAAAIGLTAFFVSTYGVILPVALFAALATLRVGHTFTECSRDVTHTGSV